MKRIAVLVSGSGSNLQALIDAQNRGEINGEIVVVISNKEGVFALERAKRAGIDTKVVVRGQRSAAEMNDEIIKTLQPYAVDLVVLAGYLAILTEEFVAAYENKIINIHPSLIPSFCGMGYYGLKVHERVLERGVKVSGATVHFVNAEADAGPIILQKALSIRQNDTPETLQKRILNRIEHPLLVKAVKLFCDDRLCVCNGTVKIQFPKKKKAILK